MPRIIISTDAFSYLFGAKGAKDVFRVVPSRKSDVYKGQADNLVFIKDEERSEYL